MNYFKDIIFFLDYVCYFNFCFYGGVCKVVDDLMGLINNRWNYYCSCLEWYCGRICYSKWYFLKKRIKGKLVVC